MAVSGYFTKPASTRGLPATMFLILFPAFFAYHVLAAFGMPMFLGAWWGLFTLVAAGGLVPIVLWKMVAARQYLIHAPVAILAFIVGAVAVYYWLFGVTYQAEDVMLVASGKLLIAWGALYAIGVLLQPDEVFASWLRRALYAMVVVSVVFMDPFDGSFIPAEWNDALGVAGYQWIAQAILFTGIAAFCFTSSDRQQILIIAVMLAGLVLAASRADLGSGLAVAVGWAVIKLSRRKLKTAVLGVLVFVAVVTAMRFVSPIVSPVYIAAGQAVKWAIEQTATAQVDVLKPRTRGQTAERYAETLDLGSSKSWAERQKYLASGWAAIKASPITGDYGSQIRDYGFFGSYIHNALSAWSQYGILAFILYLALTLSVPAVAAWQVLWRQSDHPLWLMTLFVGGVAAAMVLAVKAVYWPLPALAWGLLASRVSLTSPET